MATKCTYGIRIFKNWPPESIIENLPIQFKRNIHGSATLKGVHNAATSFAGQKKLNYDDIKSLTL
jgi:hypothetical protein